MRKLILLFALCCAHAFATAALVQSGVGALSSNTTHGNFLIFACGTNSQTNNVTGLTDTESNSWVQANWTPFIGQNESLVVFYALNIVGGTHDTILTYTGGGGCLRVFSMSEWSGMPTSGLLAAIVDGVSGTHGASGSCDPGAITTTNANDVIIGAGVNYSTGTHGFEASGYTQLTTSSAQDAEYKIVSATGSYDPLFTTTTGIWMCTGVAFKQASAAPAVGPKHKVTNQ